MKKLTVNDCAEFSWSFSNRFLLETDNGNFVWNDPDYGGDNTITRFNGGIKEFCKSENIPYVRSKGQHRIGDYCGDEVKIITD